MFMKIYVFWDITDVSEKNVASIFKVKYKTKKDTSLKQSASSMCVCLKEREILGGHSKPKDCFVNIEHGRQPRPGQCSLAWVLMNDDDADHHHHHHHHHHYYYSSPSSPLSSLLVPTSCSA
jgi:hypothetical protein